jgi:hypothetical protein
MQDIVTLPIDQPNPPSIELEAIAWFVVKDRAAYDLLEEQTSGHVEPRHIPGQLFICSGGALLGYLDYKRWQDRAPKLGLAFRISAHSVLTDLGWLWRDATILDAPDYWLRELLEADVRRCWVDEAEATILSGASERAVAEALSFKSHASRYGFNDAAGRPVLPASRLIRQAPWFLPPRPKEGEGEIARHPNGWMSLELDEFYVITW